MTDAYRPVLLISALGKDTAGFLKRPYARHVVARRVYELGDIDLARFAAVLVSAHTDQRAFAACRRQLADFLNGGGVLVFNGHVAYPFLPEIDGFVPLDGYGLDTLRVGRLREHPVFDGVEPDDLTFRRGVAGFYGRGHNPPPAGAVVLNTLAAGAVPVDWVWSRPAGGTVLMHSGNDLWMYADDPTRAARIAPQLLAWTAESDSWRHVEGAPHDR